MGLLDGTIQDAQVALDEVVDRAIAGARGLITQAAQDFEAVAIRFLDHAREDITDLIASLDGVSVTGLTPRLIVPKLGEKS